MADTNNNPLAALLNAENDREAAARRLAAAHDDLAAAIDAYRAAWSAATRAGWASTALKQARLVDPSRLPRPAASASRTTTSTTTNANEE